MGKTLWKAFEMSRNTSFTSTTGLLSKAVWISCTVNSSCARNESSGRIPYWKGVKSLLILK